MLFFALLATAFADPSKNLYENAAGNAQLSEFVKILDTPAYTPIKELFSKADAHLTVFAPVNAAIQGAHLDLSNVPHTTALLQYHVLDKKYAPVDFHPSFTIVNTLMNDPQYVNIGDKKAQKLTIFKAPSGVQLHWTLFARNTSANLMGVAGVAASNGHLYLVDRVMDFPSSVGKTLINARLQQLFDHLNKAGLNDTLSTTAGLTIFAPTDQAFRAVPGLDRLPVAELADILKYHVTPSVVYTTDVPPNGSKLPTLDGTKTLNAHHRGAFIELADSNNRPLAVIRESNVPIQNGAVHVVDRVLIPPRLAESKPWLLNQLQ